MGGIFSSANLTMFKSIRIVILLLILGSVASTVILQRNVARDWQGTLDIRIIPVLADQSANTMRFTDSLILRDFEPIKKYLNIQARQYDVDLQHSLNIKIENTITDIPPIVPAKNASRLDIILWSLKLKWWAWRHQLDDHHIAQIRLYILYQSPDDKQSLPHSTGLQNGLLGLVNARAFKQHKPIHNIIITHELLHILGASDKYDLRSGQPHKPDAYAEPGLTPLLPQRFAEIMARAIALSPNKYELAQHLRQTKISVKTAQEIGWIDTK